MLALQKEIDSCLSCVLYNATIKLWYRSNCDGIKCSKKKGWIREGWMEESCWLLVSKRLCDWLLWISCRFLPPSSPVTTLHYLLIWWQHIIYNILFISNSFFFYLHTPAAPSVHHHFLILLKKLLLSSPRLYHSSKEQFGCVVPWIMDLTIQVLSLGQKGKEEPSSQVLSAQSVQCRNCFFNARGDQSKKTII